MTNYFIDILEITLPVSVVILLLAALSPFIKRRFIAKWRYYMWLFIAIRIAMPFKLTAHKAVIEVPNVIYTAQQAGTTAVQSGISIQQLLTLIYLVGIMVFFMFQAVCWLDFSARVKRWEREADEYTLTHFNAIAAELDMKRSVRTVVCKAVSTPMMIGLFRPKLILPDRQFSERELNVILKHELIHLKNNDILYKLVLMAANGLNWFNPVIYLMVRMANRDVELVCDSEVVRGMDIEYRQEYCRTILLVVHKRLGITPPLSTGFAISKQIIKERIEDILSLKLKKRGIALFAAVAMSVVAAGSVIGFAKESIKTEVEENFGILERTTPAPEKTEEPVTTSDSEPVSQSVSTQQPVSERIPTQIQQTVQGSVTAEQSASVEEPESTQAAEQTGKVSWWNDDMNMTREELDAELTETKLSDDVRNISSGESSSVGTYFDERQSVTMNDVYYVEPNKSMTIYHNGGVVQVADAVTGELVYDSSDDESETESIIEAGEDGMYYRVNLSQSEEDEKKANMYIIEK